MEDTLQQLGKEIVTPKFGAIKNCCNSALAILQNEEALQTTEAWKLREICLEPLQLALESRAKKLAYHALTGIQHIFRDERFHSSLEAGEEDKWLPVQILNTLYMTPSLPEDIQVEIMKLLLNMTLTTAWCMNARIVTKISQLYLSCHAASPRSFAGQMAATCLKESLAEWYGCQTCQIHRSDTMKILMARLESCKDGPAQGQREDCSDGSDMNKNGEGSVSQVYIETYRDSSQGVRAPVQAAMTQMLTNFMETLKEIENNVVDDGDDVLADFKSTAPAGSMESIMEEVVALLHFLLDKMDGTQSSTPGKHVLLLLLEGVHAILNKVPTVIQHNALFQELVWKHLCPTLISLLGTPKMEKSASAQRTAQSKEEMGRGSGCSTSAPNIMASAAKVIYSIASELVRLVGTVGSLRPVLESLFHRMLLYPPPQHRLDALRVVKEMLGNPERLLDLCAPAAEAGLVKMAIADVGLIKLILDAVQECCHCNDSVICFTSVTCVDSLLQSLECLAHGQAISDTLLVEIKHACTELQKAGSLGTGNDLDIYGGSMREVLQNSFVSKDPSVSDSPPDSPRPVADSDGNSEASSMDMPTMKRVTVLRMCDVEGAEVQAEHAAAPLENADLECAGAGNATPQTDNTEKVLLSEKDALDLKELQNGATDAASDWVKPEEDECENAGKWSNKVDVNKAVKHQQQLDDQDVIRQKYKILRERLEGMEQQNAAQFVQQLHGITADLVTMLSITDVDEALQTFSSNFCANLSKQQSTEVHDFASGEASPSVVLNADGVYTASVAALQLCYKLSQRGFYKDKETHHISVTQRQFVDGVLSSGLLLFLSPTWLTEVYKQVLESPLMEVTNLTTMDTPLLQFLEDLDGLGSHEIGGQFLFEYRSELYSHSSGMTSSEPQEKVDAGKLVAQCILRTCWDGLLDVLSVLLNGKSSCGISFSLGLLLGMEGAKEETQRARDAICLSLNGLQTASRLSCVLGLQSKCGSAFSQLASTSCVREDLRATAAGPVDGKGSLKAAVLREKPRLVRLHAANVLSMDVVMTTGLEVGSHASDCWRHVFRCCAHISELEHTYFSHGNHQSSLPKVQQEQAPDAESAGDTTIADAETVEGPFMTAAAVPVAPRINVAELIRQSSLESGWETSLLGGGVLTPAQAAKALCGLSQEVDILFEDAASKLNLQALLSFLTELGEASRQQLQSLQSHTDAGDPSDILPVVTQSSQHCQGPHLPTNALHLYRLQEVLLAVVHSPRPLLHLMQVWAAISPYLVEATGHRDRSVSKMAVTCIHDFIVAMLTGHPEHPHFHVNEFLCKTFEDMLCLELCDSDVQDQIVCSICELVEACTKELQSGWRPLFGALRSVRIEITANEEVNEARQRHVAAVLDVFEVYLNTDNLLVFANATVDCILCLLKYVNGPGMFEDGDGEDSSDSGSDMGTTGVSSENLCLPALNYLTRCSHILASMWKMPACPVFKGAFRIQLGSTLGLVDPVIPHMNIDPMPLDSALSVDAVLKNCTANGGGCIDDEIQRPDGPVDSHSINSVDSGMLDGAIENTVCPHAEDLESNTRSVPGSLQLSPLSLNKLDKGSGVLHVWYLLLDGLATAITSCPCSFQPQTLTTLFELLHNTADVPGSSFALYCVNHLLLPMLQSWLRHGSRIPGYWDKGAINFRQCCGLTTDLVVEFISKFTGKSGEVHMLELMLKQLFDVLNECVAQPTEVISRLGCSCIRHVLLSSGPFLTEPMWNISAQCLERTFTITTYSVRQLMTLFHPNSDNFYGDIGQVKVATRKDCVAMDSIRLRQLAQQVFLLDSQMCSIPQLQYDLEEDKSFVFLLYPPEHHDSLNPDHISARVPLRDIVVGLLSNQLLLQTLDCILLDGAGDVKQSKTTANRVSLPGLLPYMSTRSIMAFLSILESSYQIACEFDMRPGLKFLLQKVIGLEVAANLYRQAGASMVLYLHTLTHLCSHLDGLSMEKVQTVLAESQTSDGGSTKCTLSAVTCNKKTGDSNKAAVNATRCILEDKESEPAFQPTKANASEIEPGSKTKVEPTSVTQDVTAKNLQTCPAEDPQTTWCVPTQTTVPRWKSVGMSSFAKPWDSADVFLPLLRHKCDEVCQQYVDILAEGNDESIVDRMANRPLFFLIAQPDDITELTKPHKSKSKDVKMRKPPLRSEKQGKDEILEPATVITPAETQLVGQNGTELENHSSSEDDEKHEKTSEDITEKIDDEDAKRLCSKQQLRAERESKVYSVATEKVIQNLIGQYKRHKQQNAMPSSFIKFARRHPSAASRVPRREPVDDAIDKQQKSSIMKDSEARRRSWSEMLVMVLQLFLHLPDPRFHPLLPAVFFCVNQLICHAQEPSLRDVLAQWFQRLGQLYNFGPKTQSPLTPPVPQPH